MVKECLCLQANRTDPRISKAAADDAVGIGVPGLRSAKTHAIETSPNIPCLKNVNLEQLVAEQVHVRCVCSSENNTNAAAYAGIRLRGRHRPSTHGSPDARERPGLGACIEWKSLYRIFRLGGELVTPSCGKAIGKDEGPGSAAAAMGMCTKRRSQATGIVATAREHRIKVR